MQLGQPPIRPLLLPENTELYNCWASPHASGPPIFFFFFFFLKIFQVKMSECFEPPCVHTPCLGPLFPLFPLPASCHAANVKSAQLLYSYSSSAGASVHIPSRLFLLLLPPGISSAFSCSINCPSAQLLHIHLVCKIFLFFLATVSKKRGLMIGI